MQPPPETEETVESLQKQLADVQARNARLYQEKRLFEDSLSRVPPDARVKAEDMGTKGKRAKETRQLTLAQKVTIAQKEVDDVKTDINNKQSSAQVELERGEVCIRSLPSCYHF